MRFTRLKVLFTFAFLSLILTSCIKDDQNDSHALNVSSSGLPIITTKAVTNIAQVSALCGGRITSDEGSPVTSYGVCWSTFNNPTVNDFKTNDGFGIGNFTSSINNLMVGTTYNVRAYAKNENGVSYGAQQSFTTGSSLELGINYEGGIIFYLDATGQHGLVCAELDQSNAASWGCPNVFINGADAASVGSGYQDTQDILNDCRTAGIAADYCDKLSLKGFDDWFLPSKEELKLMYNNLRLANMGNFSPAAYWASTEMTNVYAWQVVFDTGIIQGANKSIPCSVRAVRVF